MASWKKTAKYAVDVRAIKACALSSMNFSEKCGKKLIRRLCLGNIEDNFRVVLIVEIGGSKLFHIRLT